MIYFLINKSNFKILKYKDINITNFYDFKN